MALVGRARLGLDLVAAIALGLLEQQVKPAGGERGRPWRTSCGPSRRDDLCGSIARGNTRHEEMRDERDGEEICRRDSVPIMSPGTPALRLTGR
jgi:hypothetical protein